MTAEVLFANAELEVRHVPAADASRHVVTFDRYHDDRTLARPGFGEDFFIRHGIAATHVLTRDNDWFQYPWLPDALAAVRAATAGAASVMAYGSSMGGYAAVRFAAAVGATRALALSPQYSIDPCKMPSENRWAQDMRRLRFLPEVDGPILGGPTLGCITPVVAYDPWCPDAGHADRIAADISIIRLRVPFADHSVAAYLSGAGLLTPLVMQTLDGALDPAAAERAIRRARRAVPTYYCGLARRQPACRPNLAVALARQAVRLAPDAPDPHHALALCLSAAGRFPEAVAAHQRVAELDRNPGFLIHLSYDLSRAGDAEGALAVAHEVLQVLPAHAGIRSWLAELHRLRGDLPGALAHAGQALALDPGSGHCQAHVAALTAALHPPPPEPEPEPEPPPPPPPRVLFQSADVLVRHVPAADASRHVVTFDCYHDDRTLDRPGFGETFFRDHGITATHVLTRDNDWFQHPEMAEATAAIRAVTAGAAAVLAYGSSMGAYAAVRFADAVGAGQALALSPQYSIDPARAPFERRWGQDRRRLRFLPGIDGPIRSRVRPIVAYDPHGPDRPHADRIAADTPIVRLPVPHSGHPVGSLLSEAGLLTGIVMQALDGTLDPAETGQAIRARRRRLSAYFGALASRQPASRPRLAVALAQRAVELAPGRPDTHHALALRLSAAGRFGEAVAAHQQVAALERHPGYLMDFSHALHAAGDSPAALAIAHEVRAAWPHHGGVHHWISDVLRAQGDLAGALDYAQQAAALDPASELYRRTAAMLQAKLRPWSPRWAVRFAWLRARRLLRGGQAGPGCGTSPLTGAGVLGSRQP